MALRSSGFPAAVAVLFVAVRGKDSDSSPVLDPGAAKPRYPRLVFLGLRCSDRPVDLRPPFSPSHYVYRASLDFSDGSFAVDALPDTGLEVLDLGPVQTTRFIPPGDNHRVDIRVRDPKTQETMQYSVTVGRLDGRSLQLRALEAPGATMTPLFDPSILQYNVRLPPEQEYLSLRFVPWDTGQTFQVLSAPGDFSTRPPSTTTSALPTAPPAVNASNSQLLPKLPIVGGSRRLQLVDGAVPPVPSGETQYSVLSRRFPIDVGASRLVTMKVRPANGDSTTQQSYRLQASRAPCPPERPFFVPDINACAVTCEVGRYADVSVGRCLSCNTHCLSCTSWGQCMRCEPSQWRSMHFVQLSDGYCKVLRIPWRPVLSAVAALMVLLAVCCCLCRVVSTHHRIEKTKLRQRRSRTLRSERLLRGSDGVETRFEQSDDE